MSYRGGDKLSCSRILSDGDFQLTEPSSAKIFVELVEEAQEPQKLRKKILGKYIQKIFETSVKLLSDLQLSLRSSGMIFTGKKAHRLVQNFRSTLVEAA